MRKSVFVLLVITLVIALGACALFDSVSSAEAAQEVEVVIITPTPEPTPEPTPGLSGAARDLTVGGVLWSEEDPMASINEQWLGVGDTIQGYEIVVITRKTVEVEKDGVRYELDV